MQSPQWPEVQALLGRLSPGQTYYRRGSKEATRDAEQMVAQHRLWVSGFVSLQEFPHSYVTNGATEGINQWRMTDSRPWQYLKGDYTWPQLVSGNGAETTLDKLSPDRVLYVSNPCCRDGNLLSQDEVLRINSIGCPVILDCAYLGAIPLQQIPLFKNTEQILFSFSKGWGLIGQRAGLLYSKQPHATLKHMQRVECWNYQTVEIMRTIMNNYAPDSMHKAALSRQASLCKQLGLTLSDTYFLATSTDLQFERQMRVDGIARLCLTPFWSDHEH